MNERILNAVAAAAPRRFLVDALSSLLALPVFTNSSIDATTTTQLEKWQQYCIRGTVAEGDPRSVRKLLELIAGKGPPLALSMLQKMAATVASPRQQPARARMIQFIAKPPALTLLEQHSDPEIRKQVEAISFIFSWPGLPTYGREFAHRAPPMEKEHQVLFEQGRAIYRELCTTCHGPDGRGMTGPDGRGVAPPLPESPRLEENREASIQIMLHGLTGELDGRTYEGLMAPFGAANDDEWVASILTFVRREWGNSGSAVLPAHVATTREKFQNRSTPWKQEELSWKLPHKK